jgi:hypothetical protein
MCLNEIKDEFKDKLAPTDSRFRQDIRQLELGNLGKKIISFFVFILIILIINSRWSWRR